MSELPAEVQALLAQATAENVLFVKLGKKSVWWPLAKETSTIRIGFREFDFGLCSDGKWPEARKSYTATGARKKAGSITSAVNQVQEFFERPISTLWFTIEDGDVWWGFAHVEVTNLQTDDDASVERTGARYRRLVDHWRNTDVNGNPLRRDSMTTKITKVASFQETICNPGGASDLLRRIRCVPSDAHALTTRNLDGLVLSVGDLLDQLHQDDFELLVELIFSASGWKRISPLGGNQKTLDLALILPTTGEHCFVQVKSQTNQATFGELVAALDSSEGYSRMFFVYHTPATPFRNEAADRVTVWHRYEIAKQAIRAGLVDWILSRTT